MLLLQSLAALVPAFLAVSVVAQSGDGKTTRYWDCCKPSCGWPKKVSCGLLPEGVRETSV